MENNLTNTAIEYKKGIDKMTEQFKKKFGELVFDDGIDTELLELFKSMFGLIDISTKLVVEQAEMIQQINNKLDYMAEPK